MKQVSIWRFSPAAILAGTLAFGSAKADTTITSFDNFTPNALYSSWSSATINATATNYIITATGYGSLWKQYGPLDISGNTNLVLDIDIGGTASADGNTGILVDLTDVDGTQIAYRFYGRSRGHHLLVANLFSTNGTDNGVLITNNAFRVVTNSAGSPPGLNLSQMWHLNLECDPYTNTTAYTLSLNDLSATSSAGGGNSGSTGVGAVVNSFDNTTLNLAANWTSQVSTPSNIQITATGFGDGWATTSASTTSNKTLQFNVTLTAPGAAIGKLGPIVVLQDGDGTQIQYAFYGQNPATNLVLTKALTNGNIVAAGSTPGFDYSTISFFHVQLDPSSYSGSYTISLNDLSVVGCSGSSSPPGTNVCVTVDNFNNDLMDGMYGAWNFAGETSTSSNLQFTATGYGGGYHHLSPSVGVESNKTLRVDVTLTGTVAANGKLGPIVVLEDGDGTQLQYAWYGQNPGSYLLTAPLSAGNNVQAGSIPGFNFSTISFFHLQLDPSSYTGSYTVAWNNLEIFGCTPVTIMITGYSYDPNSGQFNLTWTSETGASYSVESSATVNGGYSPVATGVPSGGTSTTIGVFLSDPNGFIRIRKE